jgi:hypothetical protein
MGKYRKAAEKIFKGDAYFACDALEDLNISKNNFEYWFRDQYSILFGFFPGSTPHSNSWFGVETFPENQLARQLALLFMEHIERDEK